MRWTTGLVAASLAIAGCSDGPRGTASPATTPDRGTEAPSFAVATGMSCVEIAPFVDLLQDAGIQYDLLASQDPTDLLSSAATVVRGHLVGATHVPPLIEDDEIRHGDQISFTVELGDVLHPAGADLFSDPEFSLGYNPAVRNAQDFIDLLPTGVDVIVLAGAQGSVLLEGFWMECTIASSTSLVGLTSVGRGWPELHTLGELEAALRLG